MRRLREDEEAIRVLREMLRVQSGRGCGELGVWKRYVEEFEGKIRNWRLEGLLRVARMELGAVAAGV